MCCLLYVEDGSFLRSLHLSEEKKTDEVGSRNRGGTVEGRTTIIWTYLVSYSLVFRGEWHVLVRRGQHVTVEKWRILFFSSQE